MGSAICMRGVWGLKGVSAICWVVKGRLGSRGRGWGWGWWGVGVAERMSAFLSIYIGYEPAFKSVT
jgi:hypothetical protein